MATYEKALYGMVEKFGRDYQFSMATVQDGVPSIRFVDTFFDGECFYLVSRDTSRKAIEIMSNPNVALCGRKNHQFKGRAYNIGHPLHENNREVRKKLIHAFQAWYYTHNDETDEHLCYIKIEPTEGWYHKDGVGYVINFVEKTAAEYPFTLGVNMTED